LIIYFNYGTFYAINVDYSVSKVRYRLNEYPNRKLYIYADVKLRINEFTTKSEELGETANERQVLSSFIFIFMSVLFLFLLLAFIPIFYLLIM